MQLNKIKLKILNFKIISKILHLKLIKNAKKRDSHKLYSWQWMTFFNYVNVTKLAKGHRYIFGKISIEESLWIIYISSGRKCFKNISGGVYTWRSFIQQY